MPTYLVSGTNRGIGLEYIRHLSTSHSNRVIALVRSLQRPHPDLESIKASGVAEIHILECDTSSQTSILMLQQELTQLFSADGKIDFVINNAAILEDRELDSLNLTRESLDKHMNVNVMGPTLMLQAVLPFLKEGSIVANITSGIGSLSLVGDGTIPPAITAYSVSKAALNMLTIHQAYRCRDMGIVVVCVDPGHVKTVMGGEGAVLEPEFSAGSVLKTLAGLTMKDSGKFFLYDGKNLPW